MSNTSVQTGSSPVAKSVIARFIGIITSPKATFESVVASPKWLGMLVLCAGSMALLLGGFLMTQVGQDAWLDAAVSGPFSRNVSEQQIQAMQKMSAYVGVLTMGYMLVVIPIFMAVIAGILYAVFNAALGGTGTFKQVFTVVVHTGPIGLLSQLFTVPLNYFRGTMTSATTLGVMFPMLPDGSFGAKLLGMIDLFLVWQLIVLSIGLAVLYRRRTQPIAMTFLGLYAVIAIIIAFVRRGV